MTSLVGVAGPPPLTVNVWVAQPVINRVTTAIDTSFFMAYLLLPLVVNNCHSLGLTVAAQRSIDITMLKQSCKTSHAPYIFQ
jgi:hypothetical protein